MHVSFFHPHKEMIVTCTLETLIFVRQSMHPFKAIGILAGPMVVFSEYDHQLKISLY